MRTPNFLPTARRGKPAILALALAALSCAAAAGARAAQAQEKAQDDRGAGKGPPAREIAEGVRVNAAGAAPAALRAEPVYLFDDPARGYTRGAIWAWGMPGRPAAIMAAAIHRRGADSSFWLYEMTSLSPGPLAATVPGGLAWTPAPGVVAKPLPKSPAPAGDETRRLLQSKGFARRFEAFEYFTPKGGESDRYQLRLLPQPVLRYADPASGLVDGALFFFVYGRNPEVALLLEARREGDAAPAWVYGLARLGAARLHVNLDGAEVWQVPRSRNGTPNDPYWLFLRPLGPGDLEESGSPAP